MNLQGSKISFDTETVDLFPYNGSRPWMISACDTRGVGFCTEWSVCPWTRHVDVDKYSDGYRYIKELFEDDAITKVFFNAPFDILMAESIGIICKGRIEDVSLKMKIYKSNEWTAKLKPLAEKYAGVGGEDELLLKKAIEKLSKIARNRKWNLGAKIPQNYWLCQYAFELLEPQSLEEIQEAAKISRLADFYCRMDTYKTIMLNGVADTLLQEDPDFVRTYEREISFTPIAIDIERNGIRIHPEESENELHRLEYEREVYFLKIIEHTNIGDFNPNSPKQLSKFMYETLGLPIIKRTGAGFPSTKFDVIVSNFSDVPFCKDLLIWRMYDKGINSFFSKYQKMMAKGEDGNYYIHGKCNQMGARTTGRQSFNSPNLQQIPNPDSSAKRGAVIQGRSPFGPRDGYEWWLYDFKGQELQIFACLAKCDSMLSALKAFRDVNIENANKVWGGKQNMVGIKFAVDMLFLRETKEIPENVLKIWERIDWNLEKAATIGRTPLVFEAALRWLEEFDYQIAYAEKSLGLTNLRTRIKMGMFGLLYGAGDEGIGNILRIGKDGGAAFASDIHRAFPEIMEFSREKIAEINQSGRIKTAYGRILRVKKDDAYKAINYAIQGTAADMMKIAQIRVREFIRQTELDFRIALSIHDELIVEQNKTQNYIWAIEGVKVLMEDHEEFLGMPMQVDVKRCPKRWHLEHDYNHSGRL